MNKRVAWSICRYVLSLFIVVSAAALVFIWWAVGGSLPKRSSLPLEEVQGAPVIPAPKFLVVASYNIGHGQGIKENAWDYRDKKTTERQLELLSEAMVKLNADIFLLQEVDLDSNRTFRINQIELLKNKTKHPYHACAIIWEKNYLPFPYWPPAHHLGYIRAANCILSRFPLSNHERIIFDKPKCQPYWYNLGFLDRGIQRVDVALGEKKLAVLNLHMEAWDMATREEQIKTTLEYVKQIELPVILGGDFNTVMPDAPKKSGFTDDEKADYDQEKTLAWFITHAEGVVIPTLTTVDDPFELYTYPSNNPDRRLDHIFLLGKSLSFIDFRVGREAGVASDHLPVLGTIEYK